MKLNIKDLNTMIDNDLIPSVLDFTIDTDRSLDWSKVSYNNHYKSFDYFSNKLPNGWQSIPGFDKVIEDMAISATSPLEEMNKLIEISKIEGERLKEIEKYNNESYERNSDDAQWFSLETFDFIFKK
jgi:hypothetical protein